MSLSQADFRRLLETPRVAPQGGGGGGLRKDAIQAKFGGKRGAETSAKGPKDREKYKKFKKPVADDDDPQKKPRAKMLDPTYQGKYRDRAAERRAGVNSDYEGLEDINTQEMDIETTKFLGGDMKHTHLVKGLDLALLAQLKREKEKLQEQHASLVRGSTSSSSTPHESSSTTKPLSVLGSFLVKFVPKLSVDYTKVKHVSDLFLPGRLHYEFNVHSLDVDTLPRFVQVSPDDCPAVDVTGVPGYISPHLLEDIQDCFQEPKHAQRRVRQRQAAVSAPPRPAPVVVQKQTGLATIAEDEDEEEGEDESDDEDIFADAGEYVPPGEEEAVATDVAVSKGAIFENLSAAQVERDARAKQAAALEATRLNATLAKAKVMYEKGEAMAAEREKAERLRQKVAARDDYDECFPDYEEMDDEEDDEAKKKKKKKDGEDSDDDETQRKDKPEAESAKKPGDIPATKKDRKRDRAGGTKGPHE